MKNYHYKSDKQINNVIFIIIIDQRLQIEHQQFAQRLC